MGEDYEDYPSGPTTDLDDIDGTLHEILLAIKNKDSGGCGPAAVMWVLVVIFFLTSWPGPKLVRFIDRVWYSVGYDTDWKNVDIQKRPGNCDFFHVPIGVKDCSYKKGTNIFGDEERKVLVGLATTPEEKQEASQRPNSVTLYWEKREEP
jgi:hypothetical protein